MLAKFLVIFVVVFQAYAENYSKATGDSAIIYPISVESSSPAHGCGFQVLNLICIM